jgi:hypothetical protein
MAPHQRHDKLIPNVLTGIHRMMLVTPQFQSPLPNPLALIIGNAACVDENGVNRMASLFQLPKAETGIKATRKGKYDRFRHGWV